MSEQYTSSIIFKYGDIDRVKQDVKTLNDILDRQGTALLIDVLAEYVGKRVLVFQFNSKDATNLRDALIKDLSEAINERI